MLVLVTAGQLPHQLMRNHQLVGPLDRFSLTDWSLFTVAVRLADGHCASETDGSNMSVARVSARRAARRKGSRDGVRECL